MRLRRLSEPTKELTMISISCREPRNPLFLIDLLPAVPIAALLLPFLVIAVSASQHKVICRGLTGKDSKIYGIPGRNSKMRLCASELSSVH